MGGNKYKRKYAEIPQSGHKKGLQFMEFPWDGQE